MRGKTLCEDQPHSGFKLQLASARPQSAVLTVAKQQLCDSRVFNLLRAERLFLGARARLYGSTRQIA